MCVIRIIRIGVKVVIHPLARVLNDPIRILRNLRHPLIRISGKATFCPLRVDLVSQSRVRVVVVRNRPILRIRHRSQQRPRVSKRPQDRLVQVSAQQQPLLEPPPAEPTPGIVEAKRYLKTEVLLNSQGRRGAYGRPGVWYPSRRHNRSGAPWHLRGQEKQRNGSRWIPVQSRT